MKEATTALVTGGGRGIEKETGILLAKKAVPLVEAVSEAIMSEFKFLTIEENLTMWYWEMVFTFPALKH